MPAITNTLIEVDAQGVAWISGTKVKVIEVALDKLAQQLDIRPANVAQASLARGGQLLVGLLLSCDVENRLE